MKIPLHYLIPIFIAWLTTTCYGQKFSFGSCRTNLASTVRPAGLTMANLVGTWRETARTKSSVKHGWGCVTYTITQVTANVRYNIVITGRKKITNTPITVSGVLDIGGSAPANTATANTFLDFVLNYRALTRITRSTKYFIVFLNAAAANTLVLYACTNVAFGKIESAILLTKATTTETNADAGLQALSNQGFPAHKLALNFKKQCVVCYTPKTDIQPDELEIEP